MEEVKEESGLKMYNSDMAEKSEFANMIYIYIADIYMVDIYIHSRAVRKYSQFTVRYM